MRLLYGSDRGRAGEMLHQADREYRRKAYRHRRRSRQRCKPSSAAAGLSRRAGRPMRLLPVRNSDLGQGAAGQEPETLARGDCASPGWQYLPLRIAQSDHARSCKCGGRHARGSGTMNGPLPGPLNDNPVVDRWVVFPSAGKVSVLTGRVELGQGVLTAMAQIAADELDIAMERITIRSGDTEKVPNEGYTAGSQSIQFGGVA